MNRIEKLRSNIETLKDSLALDWSDLDLALSDKQRTHPPRAAGWRIEPMSARGRNADWGQAA